MSNPKHMYHLVETSPWPLVGSVSVLLLTFGGVLYMHGYGSGIVALLGFVSVLTTMYFWWKDVIRESTYQGYHTIKVQNGLRIGVILFILTEVMFFAAFFWAFFHSSLAPTHEIGSIWPPKGIEIIEAFKLPLVNTALLLTSGVSVTWAHHEIVNGTKNNAKDGILLTIILAFIFTALQIIEYSHSSFKISDSVYGSAFFLATGFHGLHVLIGSIFLAVCWYRLHKNQFSKGHHFGFEAAVWYWHFVDVVWLFLFVSIYWWGGIGA